CSEACGRVRVQRPQDGNGGRPNAMSLVSATHSKELKMKALPAAFAFLSALTSASISGTVTVPDNSSALPGVAAATAELLLDAGLKPHSAGGGLLVVEARNFHCDQVLNSATEAVNMHAGLPTVKCRTNSPNKRGATSGPLFNDGRSMLDLL